MFLHMPTAPDDSSAVESSDGSQYAWYAWSGGVVKSNGKRVAVDSVPRHRRPLVGQTERSGLDLQLPSSDRQRAM